MPEQRITDAELAKLKELDSKATPGSWWADRPTALERGCFLKTDSSVSILPTIPDAELCAAARNHLPALIAEIEAKREKVVLKTLSTDHHTSGKHEGCPVFSWAGVRPKFCPQCGREISWK